MVTTTYKDPQHTGLVSEPTFLNAFLVSAFRARCLAHFRQNSLMPVNKRQLKMRLEEPQVGDDLTFGSGPFIIGLDLLLIRPICLANLGLEVRKRKR